MLQKKLDFLWTKKKNEYNVLAAPADVPCGR